MECFIRKWNIKDAAHLAEMLNNKKILDNLRDGLPYPYTIKDAEEYITAMLLADQEKTFAFAITLGERAIGSIGVFRCENIHFRTAEMGYYIGEPYWGKGIMTIAVRQQNPLVRMLRPAVCWKNRVFNLRDFFETTP